MMHGTVNESDWKLYARLLDGWRDRYLSKVNARLAKALDESAKTPTENFWDTQKEFKKEAKILKTCFGAYSRSAMVESMLLMRRYGIITDDDIVKFSDDLKGVFERVFGQGED